VPDAPDLIIQLHQGPVIPGHLIVGVVPFGAPSHGLFTRCLRLATFLPALAVVRPPKARFQLVVNLGWVGLATHQVPREVTAYLHRFLLTQSAIGDRKVGQIDRDRECPRAVGSAHAHRRSFP
jgi:hypothetical protein